MAIKWLPLLLLLSYTAFMWLLYGSCMYENAVAVRGLPLRNCDSHSFSYGFLRRKFIVMTREWRFWHATSSFPIRAHTLERSKEVAADGVLWSSHKLAASLSPMRIDIMYISGNSILLLLAFYETQRVGRREALKKENRINSHSLSLTLWLCSSTRSQLCPFSYSRWHKKIFPISFFSIL